MNMNGALSNINLIPLRMAYFDVIIGMDWLSKAKAKINCAEKTVTFFEARGEEFRLKGEKVVSPPCFVSVAKARRLLRKGCQGFLCSITSTKGKELSREDIPVVRNYPEVFPEELPGMPVD